MITNREKREGYIEDMKRVEEVEREHPGNIFQRLTGRESGHAIFDHGCAVNLCIQMAAEEMLGTPDVFREILHIHYLLEQLLKDFDPDFVDDLPGIEAKDLFEERDPEDDNPEGAVLYLRNAADGACDWLRYISPMDARVTQVSQIIDMLHNVADRISPK